MHSYNDNKVKNYTLDNVVAWYKIWPICSLKWYNTTTIIKMFISA